MSESPSKRRSLEETIPTGGHSPVRDFKFCLANLAAGLALFIWAHLAQFKGEKSQPRVPDGSKETPRTKENGSPSKRSCVTGRSVEVGGWRSGVIRNAGPKKRLEIHMMCAYHEEILVQ
jgi:hypothetical protein